MILYILIGVAALGALMAGTGIGITAVRQLMHKEYLPQVYPLIAIGLVLAMGACGVIISMT